MENGTSEGTRTLMRKAQDPKSCASTNSATLAYFLIIVCNGNRVKKRPVKNLPCKNREGILQKRLLCFIKNSCAVWTAGRIIGNGFFAELTGARRCGFFFRKNPVHLADHKENHESDDQEINDCIKKLSVSDDRNVHFFGFRQCSHRCFSQIDKPI